MNELNEILKQYGMPSENIEAAANQIAQGYGVCRYLDGVSASADAVAPIKRAPSFRIVCDLNGDFRVEVLDKPINHWYIVAAKMGKGQDGFESAIEWCKKYLKEE